MDINLEIWTCGKLVRRYKCRTAKAARMIAHKHMGMIAKVGGLQLYSVNDGFEMFTGHGFRFVSNDHAEEMMEAAAK